MYGFRSSGLRKDSFLKPGREQLVRADDLSLGVNDPMMAAE
jgi:hypothetical protein